MAYDPAILNICLLLGLKGSSAWSQRKDERVCVEPIAATVAGNSPPKSLLEPVSVPIASRFPVDPERQREIEPDHRVQQGCASGVHKDDGVGTCPVAVVVGRGEKMNLPAIVPEAPRHVIWKLPVHNTIWHPMYAGANYLIEGARE